MRALPWVLGGGAAAVAIYYWRRGTGASGSADDSGGSGSSSDHHKAPDPSAPKAPLEPLPGRWVWPVGVWQARKPAISDGFDSKRRVNGQLVTHGGVDVMYRRQAGDPWRAGTPNGTTGWVMPDHRAVLAASDGVVWRATSTPRGWTVIVDHSPRKIATYYTHMSSLLVEAKQPVNAGTPLGVIGADPLDGEHIMHLHFEVWRGGAADRIDPQPLIEKSWEYLPDPGDRGATLVARNGTHRPRDDSEYSVPVITHYRRPRR